MTRVPRHTVAPAPRAQDRLRRHAIISAIQKGKQVPEDQWPKLPVRSDTTLNESGVIDLMQAALRHRASEVRISPGLVATRSDLEALARHHFKEGTSDILLLHGWRKSVFAEDLIKVLSGKVSLGVDSSGQKLRMSDPNQ